MLRVAKLLASGVRRQLGVRVCVQGLGSIMGSKRSCWAGANAESGLLAGRRSLQPGQVAGQGALQTLFILFCVTWPLGALFEVI